MSHLLRRPGPAPPPGSMLSCATTTVPLWGGGPQVTAAQNGRARHRVVVLEHVGLGLRGCGCGEKHQLGAELVPRAPDVPPPALGAGHVVRSSCTRQSVPVGLAQLPGHHIIHQRGKPPQTSPFTGTQWWQHAPACVFIARHKLHASLRTIMWQPDACVNISHVSLTMTTMASAATPMSRCPFVHECTPKRRTNFVLHTTTHCKQMT